MFITTEYTIVFVFPEDHNVWSEWRKTNDISAEWHETITTASAIYTKKTQYWTNAKGAE